MNLSDVSSLVLDSMYYLTSFMIYTDQASKILWVGKLALLIRKLRNAYTVSTIREKFLKM